MPGVCHHLMHQTTGFPVDVRASAAVLCSAVDARDSSILIEMLARFLCEQMADSALVDLVWSGVLVTHSQERRFACGLQQRGYVGGSFAVPFETRDIELLQMFGQTYSCYLFTVDRVCYRRTCGSDPCSYSKTHHSCTSEPIGSQVVVTRLDSIGQVN